MTKEELSFPPGHVILGVRLGQTHEPETPCYVEQIRTLQVQDIDWAVRLVQAHKTNFALGLMIKTGYCTCNSPIIEILGDFFVEGILEAGKILEKVICPALHALDVVMAIGMAAIPPPGKAITGGMSESYCSTNTLCYN
jgi:hypothetical protein